MKDILTNMMDCLDMESRANGVIYRQEELFNMAMDLLIASDRNDEHLSNLKERLYND